MRLFAILELTDWVRQKLLSRHHLFLVDFYFLPFQKTFPFVKLNGRYVMLISKTFINLQQTIICLVSYRFLIFSGEDTENIEINLKNNMSKFIN